MWDLAEISASNKLLFQQEGLFKTLLKFQQQVPWKINQSTFLRSDITWNLDKKHVKAALIRTCELGQIYVSDFYILLGSSGNHRVTLCGHLDYCLSFQSMHCIFQ